MFDVSIKGLSKLIEDAGPQRLISELAQNALDEDGVTEVSITVEPVANHALVRVVVEDDAPNGFADLSHCYTIFAESYKKSHVGKAGRFNFGEKIWLAAAVSTGREARVLTTTGGVSFSLKDGRRTVRGFRGKGSEVSGYLKATREQYEKDIIPYLESLLIPEKIRVTLNGNVLPSRKPFCTFQASLPTVLADGDGVLRNTTHKGTVELYEPLAGESASIFELGVPVVETFDRWHINVLFKVPLNMNRDNVTPSYLRTIRTLAANETAHLLKQEDANKTWVNEAISDERATPALVHTILKERFGDKVVVHNPADPEASANAFAAGFTVVHGRQLSKEAWEQVREKAPIPVASDLFKTRNAFEGGPGSTVAEFIPEAEWTPGIKRVAKFCRFLHKELFGNECGVTIYKPAPTNEMHWEAAYGGNNITFHLKRLGHRFFDEFNQFNLSQEVLELVFHEFCHHEKEGSDNHLDHAFYEAALRIGAKFARLCLARPEDVRKAAS